MSPPGSTGAGLLDRARVARAGVAWAGGTSARRARAVAPA